MVLKEDYKYLEKKQNLSFPFVSSVAHRVGHLVDTQQMLMTSHRTADVPDIQLQPQRISLLNPLAVERAHSLIICSVGIQHCTMLLSQLGALERW